MKKRYVFIEHVFKLETGDKVDNIISALSEIKDNDYELYALDVLDEEDGIYNLTFRKIEKYKV